MHRKISPAILILTLLGIVFTGCSVKERTDPAASGSVLPETAEQTRPVGKKATLIEIGSTKCMPCKMMSPIMEKLVTTYPRDIKVIYYDFETEAGKAVIAKYGVKNMPSQIFLDLQGKEYLRHEGFFPVEEIEKVLKTQGVEQ